MKKKIFLALAISLLLVCLFAISVSAEVTVYNDAPARTNITVSTDDVVVFSDGFCCPSGYVFKDSTYLNQKANMFDFSYINGKTNKTYTYDDIVEVDIPQGVISSAGYAFASHKALRRVSLPSTFTSIGGSFFEKVATLEECVFEHDENSGLEIIPDWMFAYCTSLRAISFPDCVKYMTGNTQLGGCTNLTAIYLSKNLISTQGGNNASGTFGQLPNGYFVNEPFTYDEIPEKPDVYYFPANLYTMTGEAFDTCRNLNKVLVFRADNIDITVNGYTFENAACDSNGTKPTIVFTGDVDKLDVKGWNVEKIIFANENDKSASDMELSGSKTFVFCHGDNPDHLYAVAVDRAPTCTVDGVKGFECFCGEADPDENNTIVDPAPGHKKDAIVGIAYNGTNKFFDAGDTTCTCKTCGEEYTVEGDAAAIFVFRGLSAKEVEVYGKAIIQTFAVNREAMKTYNDHSDYDVVGYGLVAATELGLGGSTEIFDNDGNVNTNKAGVVNISARDENFDVFEIKVNGL
ncbi:MAG: leucine-rich repeat protein, partial [Clostridia bacterium]|nr:leucine-rich repeat protein [Clostridia bacterium]